MEWTYFIFIFHLHRKVIVGLKVLQTPKYLTGKPHPNSVSRVLNPQPVSTTRLTICTWVLSFYKQDSIFLRETEDKGFRLSVEHLNNYVKIGSSFYRFSFPPGYEWLPDTWALLCLALKPSSKVLRL